MSAPSKEELKTKSDEWLLKEWDECCALWGRYSCDCFGFYISALGNEIMFRKLNTSL